MKPATPVEEGDELELTLVEVGLYDSQAGVGKVGRLRGERARARRRSSERR